MTTSQSLPAFVATQPDAGANSISEPLPALPRRYNAAAYFVDRHIAEGRGDKLALIDDEGSYTCAQLAERVNRAGNALKQLGVQPEHRVLLCLYDSIDFAALFYGAIKIGAVAVPVNTLLTTADYEFTLSDSRASVAVVSAPLLEQFRPLLDRVKNLRVVLVSGATAGKHPKCANLNQTLAGASPQLEAVDTSADEVAFWIYTSGSTGRPKGAVHLHSSPFYTAVLFGERLLKIHPGDTTFSTTKLWSSYGLGSSLSFPLHLGSVGVLTAAHPTPQSVMSVMRKHRPTILYSVPTLYAKILADPGLDRQAGFERLRACLSAGEALPEKVSRQWKERIGVDLLDGIGCSEMLYHFITNCPGEVRHGSTGKGVAGYDIRLVADNGREAEVGEPGDLWVRGPTASGGYWNNRAATNKVFFGPWVRTGDRFMRDADGYYHFMGRIDEMLKVSGHWVFPLEVESALGDHPGVAEAAVVGAVDSEGMVKPKAFVVLREGVAASAELEAELKAFVKNRLAPFKYPRWIEFCPELPRTATAKIQRFKLRENA